jgi:hypothetical protein
MAFSDLGNQAARIIPPLGLEFHENWLWIATFVAPLTSEGLLREGA